MAVQTSSDLFREKAVKLRKEAKTAGDLAARMTLLALATSWDQMAQRFERPDPH